MFYVPANEWGMDIWNEPVAYKKGAAYLGSGFTIRPLNEDYIGALRAIDPKSGKIAWEIKNGAPLWGGVLTTGGNLVFWGTPEGYLKAADAKTGKVLWEFQTGSGVVAPPVTWQQGGEQYVAVVSGWGGAVPLWGGEVAKKVNLLEQGGMVWVFKIPSAGSARTARAGEARVASNRRRRHDGSQQRRGPRGLPPGVRRPRGRRRLPAGGAAGARAGRAAARRGKRRDCRAAGLQARHEERRQEEVPAPCRHAGVRELRDVAGHARRCLGGLLDVRPQADRGQGLVPGLGAQARLIAAATASAAARPARSAGRAWPPTARPCQPTVHRPAIGARPAAPARGRRRRTPW
jgi:hypothetical protein